MKKIVFFTGGNDLYGANKILYNTLSLFESYERIVYVPNKGPLSELIKTNFDNVKIIYAPDMPVIAKKFLNLNGISKFVKQMIGGNRHFKSSFPKDTIIYLNTLAVLPIAFFFKNYTIIHVHEILNNRSVIHRLINKLALYLADRVICVSNATANNLLEICNDKERNKITIVRNGIPPIHGSNRKQPEDKGKINITLIGRIKPQIKGHNYVLDTLQYLPKKILSNIIVNFVGSPVPGQEDDLYNLRERVNALGLSDVIHFVEFTNDITQIYDNADICLVPSVRADPFPTTVLEAMSAKRPVIGTNLGGIPEMIDDTVTGFLIPVDNPKKFADRLETLINDKHLRISMGEKGYQKYLKEYTMDNYKLRYKASIPELCNVHSHV